MHSLGDFFKNLLGYYQQARINKADPIPQRFGYIKRLKQTHSDKIKSLDQSFMRRLSMLETFYGFPNSQLPIFFETDPGMYS